MYYWNTSSQVSSGVRVAQSLVFCVVLCRSLSFFVSFCHFIVSLPSIYGFWYLDIGHKGNNNITELRTIFQRESQNS